VKHGRSCVFNLQSVVKSILTREQKKVYPEWGSSVTEIGSVHEISRSTSTDRRWIARVNSKPITALAGRPSTYASLPRRGIRKVKLDLGASRCSLGAAWPCHGVTRYRYPEPEANVTPVYARVAGDRTVRRVSTRRERKAPLHRGDAASSFIRRLLRESSEIITESAAECRPRHCVRNVHARLTRACTCTR